MTLPGVKLFETQLHNISVHNKTRLCNTLGKKNLGDSFIVNSTRLNYNISRYTGFVNLNLTKNNNSFKSRSYWINKVFILLNLKTPKTIVDSYMDIITELKLLSTIYLQQKEPTPVT